MPNIASIALTAGILITSTIAGATETPAQPPRPNILYLNAPGWSRGDLGSYVLVDGLQRLTAALAFLRSEIPAFGYLRSEYTGTMRLHSPRFRWIINNLKTRADVLQWYLEMNTGGVVHTNSELDRVRALLEEESKP